MSSGRSSQKPAIAPVSAPPMAAITGNHSFFVGANIVWMTEAVLTNSKNSLLPLNTLYEVEFVAGYPEKKRPCEIA